MAAPLPSNDQSHTPIPASTRLTGLTLAHAVLGIILLLAAISRFVALGILPLNSAEAEQALSVYQFATERSTPAIIGSPAWFSLTAITQTIIGSSDATMRIIPALFSLATVALPWLLRKQLGSVGALVTALLIAISPLHSATGRTAGGSVIAIFAGLLLVVAILADWPPSRRWLFIAISIAIGLASAPLFYSIALTVGLATLLQRMTGHPLNLKRPEPEMLGRIVVAGAVLFITLTTLLFLIPSGFGAAADIAGNWISQFGLGRGLLIQWRGLLAYEPILLIPGLPFLLISLPRLKDSLYSYLLWWMLLAFAMILLQAGQMESLTLFTLPVYLLIGHQMQTLIGQDVTWMSWLIAAGLSLWGMITLVNIGRFTRLSPNLAPLLVSLLILCAIALLIMLYLPDRTIILPGVMLSLLVVWLFYGWGSAWSLTRDGANDPREPWTTLSTDSDIRLLRNTLQESGYQFAGSSSGLEIVSTVDSPPLRWYLRDFESVSYAVSSPPGSRSAAIIMPVSDTPTLDGRYGQASFDYLLSESAESQPRDAIARLRWLFFNDSTETVDKERITVWLRLGDAGE